jgi:act minimal PKS chain-length factor (CLF/KS beta)
LLAIRDGLIPPTVNVAPDPGYPIDLVVGEPRRRTVRAALVLARGHGGFNSAVVVRAPEPGRQRPRETSGHTTSPSPSPAHEPTPKERTR